jgi:hypothetical protein
VPEPWAKGDADGVHWEARFNLAPCDHPPHKKGAWCNFDDTRNAAEASGVEAQIRQWVTDPSIKSVHLAYFSFSNKAVRTILCEAATTRPDVNISIFLHRQNVYSNLSASLDNGFYVSAEPAKPNDDNVMPGVVKDLVNCSPNNMKVYPRGTEFGNGYLHHAKIVLASEFADPEPLHEMPEDQRAAAAETTTRWTSGSANMSASGTSLHIDNWLFFTAKTADRNAQENLCFFHALHTMKIGPGIDERLDFAKKNKACLDGITIPPRDDIVFYPVPHEHITREIYPAVKKAIDSAQTEIKVVIHRMTTSTIFNPLVKAKQRGVDVKVIVDDDTLRVGKCNGGPALDQTGQDVLANRTLRKAGIPVTYLETNGEVGQLAHNKFMVFDGKTLLQGAGNFTATSLNSSSPGNIEDFYIIKVPEIVDAYSRAWDHLREVSTKLEDHEVGNNQDAELVQGQFGYNIDKSHCP